MKLVLATGILLFAFSAPALNLDFWHSMTGKKAKLLSGLVQNYNAQNPEGKIRLQFVGSYEEAINKLRTSLLANRPPHLIQIADIGTRLMAESGKITPLQNFIDGDASFPISALLSQVRHYYEVGGRLAALPFATSNPVLYFNIDELRKIGLTTVPSTWEAFERIAPGLSNRRQKKFAITWPLHSWFLEQLFAVQGEELVDHGNGRKGLPEISRLSSPGGIRAVTFWKRLIDAGYFANVGKGWEPSEQNFLAGRSAIHLNSTSDVFEIVEKASFSVGTAPLPRFENAKGGTIVGGNAIWILSGKPLSEQKAAYTFLKYLASSEVQKTWHMNTGYFPIRKDVILTLEKEGFYQKFPQAKTAIDQLQASPAIPATQGALIGVFPQVREYIETAIEQTIAGVLTPEAALQKADSRATEAMARYNRRTKAQGK